MAVPVYCIPGIGSDDTMYDAVAERLAPAYSCIGWNLPGYGGAPALTDYGFADLARLLRDDLDRRGLERAHVLGHSIGGMVALEFAVTFPERAASVLLSGTTSVFGSRDGAFQEQFLRDRLAPLDAGLSMAELARTFMPELTRGRISQAELDKAIAAMADIPQAAYRAAMQCLVTFNRRAEIAALAPPCLLLAGELDTNAPLKTMQRMAEIIPDAEIAVFAGTGHMAPIEVPDEFAAAVRSFLERIS
jgi:pimeloyl-ACP methyl ester carboxylesterase